MYVKLIAIGIALLLIAGAVVGYGSWRYSAGYRSGFSKVLPYERRAAQAEAQTAVYGQTITQLRSDAQAEQAKAAQQAQLAQVATARAALQRETSVRDLAAWRRRFAAETATPSCQKLMETRLCVISSF